MKTCFLRQLTATYQQWYEKNPVLPLGVIGYVSDNNTFKFGDGATPWNSLPLFTGEASGGITIVGAVLPGRLQRNARSVIAEKPHGLHDRLELGR